ncbi:hypothetical protein RF55_21619 [Lasius niger]|uniref:Uncharacterized protein n=1 Tax=Lasius niger TaxID=67767 RepID=A0A0J7MQN6_LASNI|nr:hypothetical protein RF55_21619 [Lasius niger]
MLINKFGLFKRQNDTTGTSDHRLVRSYVRKNALCRVATDYDARLCKIRRVAQPEADTDVVNKLHVEQCVKALWNQQKESDEKLNALEKDVLALQTTINELRRATNANSETATNGSETATGRVRNGNERLRNESETATVRARNGKERLRNGNERLRNGYRTDLKRLRTTMNGSERRRNG